VKMARPADHLPAVVDRDQIVIMTRAQKSRRAIKPKKCSLDKKARQRLWVNLRKYCNDLFAAGHSDDYRFNPPPHSIDMFAELGLRHPRNVRALRKFYNNFIPRCSHLAESDKGRRKPQYKVKASPSVNIASDASRAVCRRTPSPPNQPRLQCMQQQIGLEQIWRWLASNCFEVGVPSALHGVHINRSPMRRDGLNILSMGYSTKHPDPTESLERDKLMVVFGAQSDVAKYGSAERRLCFADPAFCREMVNKRLIFVPIPPCMVGRTLAETPQLSLAGINTLSINLQTQHPADMCKRRFTANDTLICLFDDSANGQTEGALLLWRLLL